jgi:hypothetical protein
MKGNRRNRSTAYTAHFSPYRYLKGIIPFVIALIVTAIVFKLNLAGFSNPDTVKRVHPDPAVSPPSENRDTKNPAVRTWTIPDATPIGQPLDEFQRQRIAASLGIAVPARTLTIDRTPLFILHDTAWSMTADNIREQQLYAKGPMGLGPNAYVPRQPNASVSDSIDGIARPFFEAYRPTATHYEQAAEMLPTDTRDRLARALWRQTPESLREAALHDGLIGVPVTFRSPKELKRRARMWFNAPSEKSFDALVEQRPLHYFDGAKSTALWATREICQRVSNPTCDRLRPAFEERDRRVATSVNVEVVLPAGSHCQTSGKLQGLPDYTDYQYRETAKLYLYAAILSGQYPEVVSHYAADSFLLNQGKSPHCDPRGFDLRRLYDEIAVISGDSPGTLYGIVPRYGTNPGGGDTIWWNNRVFGGSAPM